MAGPKLIDAINWIALNDNTDGGDTEEAIACYISTALAADLFNTTTAKVASAVATARRNLGGVVGSKTATTG